MSKLPGTVVVLSGPTAVGKSTVGDAILAAIPEATRVITATTRKPRANEKDGVDYHFHSKEEFLVGIARDEFLEHAEVHGYFFGTPKDQVDAAVAEHKVVLLIIDVDGGKQIRALDPNALLIFLKPPSRNALRERIAKRGTETDAEVTKRMERVDKEMEEGEKYHVKVVNDDLDACIKDCLAAIQAHREKLAS